MRGRPWHQAVASEVRRLTLWLAIQYQIKYMVSIYLQLYLTDTAAAPASGGASGSMAAGKRWAASGRGGGLLRRRSIGEEGGGRAQARSCGGWHLVAACAPHSGRKAARQHPSENHQSKKEGIKSCREAPPTVQPTKQIRKKECGEEGTARAHK